MTPEESTSALITFILKQPGDRPVDMGQVACTSQPGCILVQFAREGLELTEFTVGSKSIFGPGGEFLYNGEEPTEDIISWCVRYRLQTYSSIREVLKGKNLIP